MGVFRKIFGSSTDASKSKTDEKNHPFEFIATVAKLFWPKLTRE